MAARRLIILMVLLLAVSTLAATLAPERNQSDEDGSTASTTTTTPVPPARQVDGELVRATIDSGAEKPGSVEVTTGDQVALLVRTPEPAQIELPDFGLIEDAERDAPARFDVLTGPPGEYAVHATTPEESGRLVGTLVVNERTDEKPAGS